MVDASPAKVLVVSPDIELQESATMVLLRAGFALDQADGLRAARQACSQRRMPDVLLVDGTRAWPGLRELLDEPPHAPDGRVPAVLLLAGPRTDEELRAHHAVGDVVDAAAPRAMNTLVALRRRLGGPSTPLAKLALKKQRRKLRAS